MAEKTTTPLEKWLAFGTVFLLALTLPLDPYYYKALAHANLTRFQDLFLLSNYIPFLGHAGQWGWHAFTGWFIAAAIAFIITIIWTIRGRSPGNTLARSLSDKTTYWSYALQVILRYRLAAALFGYGVILLFAIQTPHLSISELHTKYGYLQPWRIYYDSLAVSTAGYGVTLGIIEIVAGILLLFRRTALFGAGLAAFILINIVLANFAYGLGDHIISVYLLLIAFVLVAFETPRLYRLLYLGQPTAAETFEPELKGRWRITRTILRGAFTLFFLGYTLLTWQSAKADGWPYPKDSGLAGAAGFYDVRHFNLNGTDHPYSATDTVRWQDLVFEKWNTLSISIEKHIPVNHNRPVVAYQGTGIERYFENAGNGERIFYSYEQKGDHLLLTNKNDPADTFDLHFQRNANKQLLLDGQDHAGNKLQVGLDKVDKKYLLDLGRRHPVKVY